MCLSVSQYARHEPVDVVADMKLILQYVTMSGMMTNDPLILAHYHGNIQRRVPIVWHIMHVSYDPENWHNGQIWIDLLVYSFILKEPKIFQRASLMFIIILMKSKSSQKRRERQEDGKSKHNNSNVYLSFSPHPSFSLSTPLFPPLSRHLVRSIFGAEY